MKKNYIKPESKVFCMDADELMIDIPVSNHKGSGTEYAKPGDPFDDGEDVGNVGDMSGMDNIANKWENMSSFGK